MDQVGRVVSTNDGMASLEVRKMSSCGTNCASCNAACDKPPQKIEVLNTLDAKPGDFVEIQADSGRVLKYMLLLYGVPLLFLIIGFAVSHSYFVNNNYENYELLALVGGALFMVVGALIVKIFDKKSNIKSYNINYMVKKL